MVCSLWADIMLCTCFVFPPQFWRTENTIYMYLCECMFVCMCVCACVCVRTYVRMSVCMYACMHVCMYAYMHVRM